MKRWLCDWGGEGPHIVYASKRQEKGLTIACNRVLRHMITATGLPPPLHLVCVSPMPATAGSSVPPEPPSARAACAAAVASSSRAMCMHALARLIRSSGCLHSVRIAAEPTWPPVVIEKLLRMGFRWEWIIGHQRQDWTRLCTALP